MVSDLDLINGRLLGYEGLQSVCIRQGTIAVVTRAIGDAEPVPVLDLAGDWLSLGGVDVQINGALGLAFPDLSPNNSETLTAIAEFLWTQGVDSFLPTIVTTSVDAIQRSLTTIAHFQAAHFQAAHFQTQTSNLKLQASNLLGVHLEGPFLNVSKRGAHPAEHLLPLTIDSVKQVLGDYASFVKVMTLAPELDETGTVIPYLRSLGIIVSLGHSLATATQAARAFQQGASMVTHAFNAMPPLHHREPGLLGAAIVHPSVQCGLIADGQHVSPTMLEIFLRASQYDRGCFLVSDALAPLGLPDGRYPWDNRTIEVIDGTARLPDGTLAGTTRSLLVGAQNLVKWGICQPEPAIALATTAPRRAIGLPTAYEGQANLLRWRLESETLTWQRLEDLQP